MAKHPLVRFTENSNRDQSAINGTGYLRSAIDAIDQFLVTFENVYPDFDLPAALLGVVIDKLKEQGLTRDQIIAVVKRIWINLDSLSPSDRDAIHRAVRGEPS